MPISLPFLRIQRKRNRSGTRRRQATRSMPCPATCIVAFAVRSPARGQIGKHTLHHMKYWEIIADRLSKAGWRWGCVSALDCEGRTIWIVDAHGDDGKRYVAHADEILTAFLELESAIRVAASNFSFFTKLGFSDSICAARQPRRAKPNQAVKLLSRRREREHSLRQAGHRGWGLPQQIGQEKTP
jgi:hypothetical protein